MIEKNSSEQALHVTRVGILWNIILIIAKLIAGIYGRSSALIADAAHSVSDFISDIAVIAGIRLAARPSDAGHNYGHGKFETLATVILSIFLALAGIGILWQGAARIALIWDGQIPELPTRLALSVALLSVLIKEGLYHYTIRLGKRLDSKPLIANAWHHRTDALSSLAVFLGVGGAYFLGGKWVLLDPLAAIIVGVFILIFAVKMLIQSMNELMEASLGQEENEKIRRICAEIPGVNNPHNIKTRRVGNSAAIELHIKVEPQLSIEEAHNISTDVEKRLKEIYGQNTFTSVHVEPCKE